MRDKKSIRKEVLLKRDSIDLKEKERKDQLIRDRVFLLPQFEKAETIFYFASIHSEVFTLSQIKEAWRRGKRVILPRVDKGLKGLRLYEVNDLNELRPGCMGIPEPDVPPDRERDINDVDLVVMPGVAFDPYGNRLGYGAGYYDRLLARLKKDIPLVAIAYEEQIVDSLPHESHDVRVHMIVTDKRIIEVRHGL